MILVVGHKPESPGASSPSGMTEFDFNDQLAQAIIDQLTDIKLVYRHNYRTLPDIINRKRPDFIISMHCNAFNRKVKGSEVLYYHKSGKGKIMAQILQDEFVAIGQKDRGIKPKSSEDRGGYLLKNTHAPCVICEPFFIDSELDDIYTKYSQLVDAYVQGIRKIRNNSIV